MYIFLVNNNETIFELRYVLYNITLKTNNLLKFITRLEGGPI